MRALPFTARMRARAPALIAPFARAARADESRAWRRRPPPFAAVELRADLMPRLTETALCDAACSFKKAGLSVLLTIRCASEGGRWRGGEKKRRALLEGAAQVLDSADAVDVELARFVRWPAAAQKAARGRAALALSAHDFKKTPALSHMRAKRESAFAAGADIFKLSAAVKNGRDLRALAAFLTTSAHPVAATGMGDNEFAKISRLLLGPLGSIFNFTAAEIKSAAGQPSLKTLAAFNNLLKEF